MHVRKTSRRYKDKTYTNYLLVESISTPKGPRQRVICSLGDLSPRPAGEWLALGREVEAALVGLVDLFSADDPEIEQIVHQVRDRQARSLSQPAETSADPASATDLVTVHANRGTATDHRSAGPVHVGFQFWKRLGLDVTLLHLGFSNKVIQLTCAMTLNRLIHPDTEHEMPNWIRSTAASAVQPRIADCDNEDRWTRTETEWQWNRRRLP